MSEDSRNVACRNVLFSTDIVITLEYGYRHEIATWYGIVDFLYNFYISNR
jgi:hypothetical protein